MDLRPHCTAPLPARFVRGGYIKKERWNTHHDVWCYGGLVGRKYTTRNTKDAFL